MNPPTTTITLTNKPCSSSSAADPPSVAFVSPCVNTIHSVQTEVEETETEREGGGREKDGWEEERKRGMEGDGERGGGSSLIINV